MADDLTSRVGLDTSDFKTGVSQLNAAMKSIETGFRASAAVMDNWSGTSNGLRERVASLSDILEKQKSKLSILHDEYNKLNNAEGDNTKALESLASKMFSTEKQISNTQVSLSKYSEKLKTVEKEENSSTGLVKLKTAFSGLAEQSQKSTSSISSHLSSLKSTIMGFGAAALAGLSLKSIIDSTDTAEKTMAQMGAVIKSTGGAAGMTEKQLTDLAGAQAKVTTFGKGTTEQAENMLLTFTNIKSSVFPQTIQATEDMATAMHMDATQAAMTLGKALNDPAAGLSKLTKQGVTFTDAQKKQITAMQKAGDTAGAQKIILQELEKEFGGSAKAVGSTFTGGIQIMQNNLKSAGVTIATALIPIATNLMPSIVNVANSLASTITKHKGEIIGAVTSVAEVVKEIFNFAENHGPLVKAIIIGIGSAFVAFKTVTGIISAITGAIKIWHSITKAMEIAQAALNLVMSMNPIGLFVIALAGLVAGFVLLWNKCDAFRNFWISAWDGIKKITGGATNSVKGFFTGLGEHTKNTWNAIRENGNKALQGIAADYQRHGGGIKGTMSTMWDIYTGIYKAGFDVLNKLSGGKLGEIKNLIVAKFTEVLNWFEALPGRLYNEGSNMINGLKSGINSVLGTISSTISSGFNNAISFITSLPSKAVQWGEDFIQGFINGINSMISGIVNAVSGIADKIKSFLHFSTPDEGPLKEYEQWPKDFMEGYANGITSNAGKLKSAAIKAASALSNGLKANINIGTSGINKSFMPANTTINNTKAPVININGPINLANKGSSEATLQQLQFLAQI